MNTTLVAVNSQIKALKQPRHTQAVVSGARIAPGVWLDVDTQEANVAATWATTKGSLLILDSSVPDTGRWFTLNIDLGDQDLSAVSGVGCTIRLKAGGRPHLIRACIRCFHDNGFTDVFFPNYILAFDDYSTQSDVLWVAEQPDLETPAAWRTVLLFFEPGDFHLDISDLGLFVV